MEKLTPSMFVRYHREGKHEDHHLALVLGIFGLAEKSIIQICVLRERMPRQATPEECTPVDPSTVRGGVVGFLGHNKYFGTGEVVDEKLIDNLLYVLLERGEVRSDFIPIIDVSLCCPCNSCA